ncbi:MAG: hypothetical protein R3C52_14350 [Hyphomonadaceae bacterium]
MPGDDNGNGGGRGAIIASIGGAVLLGGILVAALVQGADRSPPDAAGDASSPPAAEATAQASEESEPLAVTTQAQETPPATDSAATQTPPEPAPTGGAVAPTIIAYKDPSLDFEVRLPPAPEGDPLIQSLKAEAEQKLLRMRPRAKTDYDDRKAQGGQAFGWEVREVWTRTATAGPLTSLAGERREYTGGAHGNLVFGSRIYDTRTDKRIEFLDMFLALKSPPPSLVVAVCEQLKAEKLARIGSETIYDEPITCNGADANIDLSNAVFALAPSDEAGRFGGVEVRFAPYDVGAYAEGAYGFTVQQQSFAHDLRAEYKDLFSGEAPPLND